MSTTLAKWTPAEVVTEKRKAFTPAQKAIIRARQKWRCNCGCGKSIKGKRHEFNHKIALALGGTHDIDNAEALLPDCHKPHTAMVKAVKSKADAQGGRTGWYARLKRNGPKLKCNRPLESRGFDKSRSKGFDGIVRPR